MPGFFSSVAEARSRTACSWRRCREAASASRRGTGSRGGGRPTAAAGSAVAGGTAAWGPWVATRRPHRVPAGGRPRGTEARRRLPATPIQRDPQDLPRRPTCSDGNDPSQRSLATAASRIDNLAGRVIAAGWATETHGINALSTVLENKPAARGGVADKLAFFNGAAVGHQHDSRDHPSRRDHPGSRAGYLQPVRRRPPHDLCRLRRREVDRHQGQDRSQFVQGLQAADHGSERGGLCRVAQAGHQHSRRLRREGARVLQPASQFPAGGRHQDRLPHAGRCWWRRWSTRRPRTWSASCSSSTRCRASRSRRRWRKGWCCCARRWRSPCASASGRWCRSRASTTRSWQTR